MKALMLVIICLMAVPSHADIFNGWWQEPYGDDSFNTNVEFGHNATLYCENGTEWTALYWILPDTSVMYPGDMVSVATFDGEGTWEVRDEGREMWLTGVDVMHFGFYYCVSNASDPVPGRGLLVTKTAINYKGPYWGDLWAKYELATIIGLSCAGGFLVIATIFCIAYSCWCDPANDVDWTAPPPGSGQQNHGYSREDSDGSAYVTVTSQNPAYIGEGAEAVPRSAKHKMSKKEKEFLDGQAAPFDEAVTPL